MHFMSLLVLFSKVLHVYTTLMKNVFVIIIFGKILACEILKWSLILNSCKCLGNTWKFVTSSVNANLVLWREGKFLTEIVVDLALQVVLWKAPYFTGCMCHPGKWTFSFPSLNLDNSSTLKRLLFMQSFLRVYFFKIHPGTFLLGVVLR